MVDDSEVSFDSQDPVAQDPKWQKRQMRLLREMGAVSEPWCASSDLASRTFSSRAPRWC